MAFISQVYTNSLSNQNIATALLVGTFTNTTRIRKVFVNIFVDQVAGNGSYVAHVTIQRAGAGSAYRGIKATLDLASGETAGLFNSKSITLNATDVMKVYVLGVAGDTTTPDIIVDVNEELPDDAATVAAAVGARTPSPQTGAPTTYDGLIYLIREFVKNKLKYDKATDNMILYENDGTTPKLTHAMTDDSGEATRGPGT